MAQLKTQSLCSLMDTVDSMLLTETGEKKGAIDICLFRKLRNISSGEAAPQTHRDRLTAQPLEVVTVHETAPMGTAAKSGPVYEETPVKPMTDTTARTKECKMCVWLLINRFISRALEKQTS